MQAINSTERYAALKRFTVASLLPLLVFCLLLFLRDAGEGLQRGSKNAGSAKTERLMAVTWKGIYFLRELTLSAHGKGDNYKTRKWERGLDEVKIELGQFGKTDTVPAAIIGYINTALDHIDRTAALRDSCNLLKKELAQAAMRQEEEKLEWEKLFNQQEENCRQMISHISRVAVK